METMAKYKPNVEVIDDLDSLARRSVEIFVSDATKAIAERGVFRVAISGGHTPKRFYQLLGASEAVCDLDWEKIHIFWVDERYVPLDSIHSNYKLAADNFLSRITVPPENVHRIPTEYSDFKEAAKAYEQAIRATFEIEPGRLPQFDLVVLGMGADGHTGSLFPNSYAAFDIEDLACVIYQLDDDLNRITLTHPVLCAARHLAVLVSGEEKADILKSVLTTTSEPDEVKYPIHSLWPVLERITWLVDSQAARLL